MSTVAYRARSTTEIIDASIQLLRHHYSNFLALNAIYYVPVLVYQWVWQSKLMAMQKPGFVPSMSDFGSFFLVLPIFIIWYAIFDAALIVAASEAYLGRPLILPDIIRQGVGRAWSAFWVYFLKSLLIMLGFILLILPAIWVSLITFAVVQVVVIEGAGPITALERSYALSKGNVGQVFGTYTLTFLLIIVAYVLFAIAGAVSIAVTHSAGLGLIFTGIGTLLIYPLMPIITTVLYYDARIRNEGYDIELMAQQMGGGAPQPAYGH